MIENLIDRLAAIVDPAAFLPSATQYVDVRSQDAARKKARSAHEMVRAYLIAEMLVAADRDDV